MINPDDVTNYNRTKAEKEEFLLFCACVAGKSAFQQAAKLHQFIEDVQGQYVHDYSHMLESLDYGIFAVLRDAHPDYIKECLEEVKMGQYTRLTKAFKMLAELDVDTCTVEDLEKIPGIGPKTARFFIVHTRPDQRYAILDTHILSHLRELRDDQGGTKYKGVPKSTPPAGRRYDLLESAVLREAYILGMTPADWDLMVWKSRRKDLSPS